MGRAQAFQLTTHFFFYRECAKTSTANLKKRGKRKSLKQNVKGRNRVALRLFRCFHSKQSIREPRYPKSHMSLFLRAWWGIRAVRAADRERVGWVTSSQGSSSEDESPSPRKPRGGTHCNLGPGIRRSGLLTYRNPLNGSALNNLSPLHFYKIAIIVLYFIRVGTEAHRGSETCLLVKTNGALIRYQVKCWVFYICHFFSLHDIPMT